MKKSIFGKIILIFLGAMLIAFILTTTFIFVANMYHTKDDARNSAINGAENFYEYLKTVDVAELLESEDTEQYKKCHNMMRTMCKSFELDFLYLFTLDENTDTMRYIIIAAAEDEMDSLLTKERGLGQEIYLDFDYTAMKEALYGNLPQEADIYENQYGRVFSWFLPVKNSQGEVVALIGSEDTVSDVIGDTISDTILFMIPVIMLLLILFLIQIIVMYRRIFKPIKLISSRMDSFVSDRESRMKPLGIKSNDEIQGIADSFENMAEDITRYIKNIEEMTTERVQGMVELDVAKRIQYGIVPETTNITKPELNISAAAKPAKSVGGDFYDGFLTDDGRACIIIGDVSGKGIAAALFMTMAKTMLRERLHLGLSPAQALNTTNDNLCASNPEGMFVTVFAAVFDPKTGVMTYANAGHTRPVIVKDKAEILDMDAGIALGLFEDAGIENAELKLQTGQGIVIYTDGITEAVDNHSGFFGEQRLINAVSGAGNAQSAVSGALKAVQKFTDGCEQFDDITILSLFFDETDKGNISLKPQLSEMTRIKEKIKYVMPENTNTKKILLACEEIFVNIISYSGAEEITFECAADGGKTVISFTDDGAEFDPINTKQADKDFDELDTGGMGIMLVRQIADDVQYTRLDGKNILKMFFTNK